MASNPHFTWKQFAAPAGVFTAIAVPVDCNHFTLKSQAGQALRIRTDQNDAATEDVLGIGYQEGLDAPLEVGPLMAPIRFRAGVVCCYVQPQPAAPDTVIGKFVR